jgi:hypothetical protein
MREGKKIVVSKDQAQGPPINAIRTLLQRNSNNSTVCDFFIYIAMAADGGFSRSLEGLIAPKFAEIRTYSCGIDLQYGGSGRSQVIDSS